VRKSPQFRYWKAPVLRLPLASVGRTGSLVVGSFKQLKLEDDCLPAPSRRVDALLQVVTEICYLANETNTWPCLFEEVDMLSVCAMISDCSVAAYEDHISALPFTGVPEGAVVPKFVAVPVRLPTRSSEDEDALEPSRSTDPPCCCPPKRACTSRRLL